MPANSKPAAPAPAAKPVPMAAPTIPADVAAAILEFLNRVPLQGAEVDAFMRCRAIMQGIAFAHAQAATAAAVPVVPPAAAPVNGAGGGDA